MTEYIYLMHPLRHEFFDSPTPQEEAMMEAHFEYLKQANEDGMVLLAGPCLDETFGVVVFRAEDDLAARTFMLNDPAVKSNVMMAEIHPMKISLMSSYISSDNSSYK
jgi:uncharacterized protein YciI